MMMAEPHAAERSQDEVVRFLASPEAYGPGVTLVERLETHGAMVFLAGSEAFKIKKAVKLPYFDFSTLERRHRACLHELELNQPTAPQIYRDVVPVTREADGSLSLAGRGEPVEWAVRMWRFPQDDLMSAMARRGPFPRQLIHDLAATIAAAHHAARVIPDPGYDYIAKVVHQVETTLPPRPESFPADQAKRLTAALATALDKSRHVLGHRARHGQVRLCHGDLHLNNLVLIDGRPVLFDAIEFDDTMASIDRLYDLAFLLMDLMEMGQGQAANLLLNRYLYSMACPVDYLGLKTLPLFMGCRAAVRAIVTADRAGVADPPSCKVIADYLDLALACAIPPPPRLIAIGGFSGTGKSTLAAALAPAIGARPGAVHLRSDLERKLLFNVPEIRRLADGAYTPDITATVYEALLRKARWTLAAGHAAVVDAVFASEDERAAVAALASRLHVPLHGLWLAAPEHRLKQRVSARVGDASDATAAIVARQLSRGAGVVNWPIVDASGTPQETLAAVRKHL